MAGGMGWERKLRRAQSAQRRSTALRSPQVLAGLAATERFSVTDLERFGDCSSIWFVERMLRPGEIDFELDAKLRGRDQGIDVLRYVRQHHPDIKVVVFSQFGWASMRKRHMDAGALAYFDKGTEFQQARDWITGLSNAQSAGASGPKP